MDEHPYLEEPPAIFNQLLSTFTPDLDFFADENKENHQPQINPITADRNPNHKFSNSQILRETRIFPVGQNRYRSPIEYRKSVQISPLKISNLGNVGKPVIYGDLGQRFGVGAGGRKGKDKREPFERLYTIHEETVEEKLEEWESVDDWEEIDRMKDGFINLGTPPRVV